MLLDILSGGDFRDIIISLVFSMPIILFALSMHETAHGYVAYKCGDHTAYNLGRLTLNPLKHLDLKGFLCMLIFGFGWAKPVPVNSRNFHNPKKGMALTALAGPAANAILGIISSVLFGALYALYQYLLYTGVQGFGIVCLFYTTDLFLLSAVCNFVFMAFNLIPVPPFDGSRVAFVFLPPKAYFGIMKYERQIMIGILVALLVISNLFNFSLFSWIANKLTFAIANPVFNLFVSLFGLI